MCIYWIELYDPVSGHKWYWWSSVHYRWLDHQYQCSSNDTNRNKGYTIPILIGWMFTVGQNLIIFHRKGNYTFEWKQYSQLDTCQNKWPEWSANSYTRDPLSRREQYNWRDSRSFWFIDMEGMELILEEGLYITSQPSLYTVESVHK